MAAFVTVSEADKEPREYRERTPVELAGKYVHVRGDSESPPDQPPTAWELAQEQAVRTTKSELISVALYDEMLVAWGEKRAVYHVAKRCRVPYKIAQRVITKGVKRLGLRPFPGSGRAQRRSRSKNVPEPAPPEARALDLAKAALGKEALARGEQLDADVRGRISSYEAESDRLEAQILELKNSGARKDTLHELREAFGRTAALERTLERTKQEVIVADQVQKSAEEAAAARLTMRTAATASAIVGHLADRILEAIEAGKMDLPKELNPRLVGLLARAAEVSASAVEKAMTIERKRTGRPEQITGVAFGVITDNCSDEELDYIVDHGQLPPRLMSTFVAQGDSASAVTDAEFTDSTKEEDVGPGADVEE